MFYLKYNKDLDLKIEIVNLEKILEEDVVIQG